MKIARKISIVRNSNLFHTEDLQGRFVTTPADLIWGALSDLGERLRESLATEAEAEGRHSEAPDDAE